MNIKGNNNGKRISSRILEETIQTAIKEGAKELVINAQGQHGIGGRIWPKYGPVKITANGPIGQRLGAMGMPGTEIIADAGHWTQQEKPDEFNAALLRLLTVNAR